MTIRKIVCCNGSRGGQSAWANDFPIDVCREFEKAKNWKLDFDVLDDPDGFITPNGKVYICDIPRDDVDLVAAFEKVNPKTHRIVEIPDDVEWEIHVDDLDYEWVVEKHREWR